MQMTLEEKLAFKTNLNRVLLILINRFNQNLSILAFRNDPRNVLSGTNDYWYCGLPTKHNHYIINFRYESHYQVCITENVTKGNAAIMSEDTIFSDTKDSLSECIYSVNKWVDSL